ncbi:AMP-binding protein [Streptomyces sp. NPDC089424]|uniref:AMP-binding protein n=1 Tax=Streptomyces sp. NPDC089424 TaxID=3365917 RepID=UPI003819610E
MSDYCITELRPDAQPEPGEFVRSAMRWHFSPDTGSPFWLRRATELPFDPLTDVREFEDLALFPQLVDELRDVRVEDLMPRGLGPNVAGVYESGGTTGAPKRVLFHHGWFEYALERLAEAVEAWRFPRNGNWLLVVPTGPHVVGEFFRRLAFRHGGIPLCVDMDPRWVKKLIVRGAAAETTAYLDHLVEQAVHVLETQNVEVLVTTPRVLERLVLDDAVLKLVRRKIRSVLWTGAHMDADTRDLLRTYVLPETALMGAYGSTMVLGASPERAGLPDNAPCIFDPPSPYTSFLVVDPATGRPVLHGERGQVVTHHVSPYMLLPNNLERDTAVRVEGLRGQIGDSVADVAPLAAFGGEIVVEGVY